MKVLVTGCAGFIGSHLTEALLANGHSVLGIDNFDDFYPRKVKERNMEAFINDPNFELKELDLKNDVELNELNIAVDAVVHLAAKAGVLPSLKNPQSYIQSNILGTANLLEYMRTVGCKKLVFASSSSVYGNNTKIPFEEGDDVNEPISIYAQTKRSCELLNNTYHHLYGFDILNLRFFTVYGPRQRPDLAIHKFFNKIARNEAIEMYGSGDTARDYTFVADTVKGIVAALDYVVANHDVNEIINLGNESPVDLKDLLDTLYQATNATPNIHQIPMQPGDVQITYADISKAKKLLGYQPTTPFKDGIAAFKKWYDANK